MRNLGAPGTEGTGPSDCLCDGSVVRAGSSQTIHLIGRGERQPAHRGMGIVDEHLEHVGVFCIQGQTNPHQAAFPMPQILVSNLREEPEFTLAL